MEVLSERSGGLVLTGREALKCARILRARNFRHPILCDADRYTGNRRDYAGREIDSAWISEQHQVSGVALTGSGFVPCADIHGLRSILDATARNSRPTIALLPLANCWLREPSLLTTLRSEVSAYGVPIAVALEHTMDPLGVQAVLNGLLTLLTVPNPVLLLRSDVSALGALSHGALAAAVGTRTGLRHIHPVTARTGFVRQPSVAAFVKHCLGYRRLEDIAAAAQRTPDQANHWHCECIECGGRNIDRLATLATRDEQETSAFRHSIHTLAAIWAEVLEPRATCEERKRSWYENCNAALFFHEELLRTATGWRAPAALRAWMKAWQPPANLPVNR